ncbi:translocation/assembly module TamB [Leptobacterium flavescens]|uniref:Translocation/assembly module TamB n=1 Tax=Leptobacterium flavescens TaxID=472055 RepID=A0A6P0UKW4_9FLAO|nr:translocation/assembly module TamB [Leptobacterium flavescens]
MPAVQNGIARRLTNSLNKDYNTNISIDKVDLSLLGQVALKGVYVQDYKKDTLIYIDRLNTSILSARNAINGKLEFGTIDIDELTFNLKTYEGERDTNLDIFVAKLEGEEDTTSTSSSFLLTSSLIRMNKSKFRLIDENTDPEKILDFSDLRARVNDFKIEGPNVNGLIRKLGFTSDRELEMEDLNTDFTYTLKQMRFDDLSIKTPKSELKGELVFNYRREDFANFLNAVKVSAKFNESTVALEEVNHFYNEFGRTKTVTFSTEIEGVLNNFTALNTDLKSDRSIIRGDFNFHNIFTSSADFKLDAGIENVSSSYYELKALLPDILGNNLPSSFAKLGYFTINGSSVITEEDINASITLFTDLGTSYSNMELTHIDDIDNASYKGFVSFIDFDLGKFLNDPDLGQATLDFNVDGSGFTQETLNTEVIGKILKIRYNEYDYTNIDVSGVLKDQLFDGNMISRDPNFKFNFKGLADLSQEKNKFNFIASVDYADFKKLNIITTDSTSVFKGNIDINMTGNSLDNVEGEITFTKTNYTNQTDSYYFEDFKVTSSFTGEERELTINSPDFITGNIKGKFYIVELRKLIENSIGSIYTNYNPSEVTSGQYMDFNLKIYNKIVEVFYPDVRFGKNTFIRGKVVADEGDFKLTFKSPRIDAFGKSFDDVNVQIDNKNPLFNTYVAVKDIDAGFYKVTDFNLINATVKDTLFFRTEFKGGDDYTDIYNLNFYHTFNKKNRSVIGLKRSDVGFKGTKWLLNKNNNSKNRVVFNRTLDSIDVDEIDMTFGEEQINLRGVLIDSTYKNIKLQFKKVALDKITPTIDSLSMNGVVNGELNILQRNSNYFPSSNLVIDHFSLNNFDLGTLDIGIIGSESITEYTVDAGLFNSFREQLRIIGKANFDTKDAIVDLQAYIDNLDLEPFSPLGEDVISDIRGFVSGEARITGPLRNPDIRGQLRLNEAGLKVPYLNVDLNFNEQASVKLHDQTIEFDNVALTDTKYSTGALLNGTITHTNFEDWFLNLKLNTNGGRFLVLDTEFSEDELYYGTGFISGEADIFGLTDALTIKVNARTEEGTSFKIPISDVTSIGDSSFINFVNKNETIEERNQRELAEYQGLELEFDLDVNDNAEVEIVVDRKSGSTLRGRGAGNLLIEINTNGKFRMWGDFLTYSGIYNFKYKGLLDKKFTVLPNGTINWDGDPLKANVNLQAVYSTSANPAVLLDNASVTRKIDTDVVIKLEGELLQPTIEYEIQFPNTNAVTVSELNYRLEDKNRRELQALSLLSQGTFINEVSITQQALTGNLIETASSLINDILNGDNDKLNIGVSYEQGDRSPLGINTEDRFGVTVSTQINERILINGKIGVPIGGVTESVVAGDVEVQILLNEDGSLSAKIFNKENEIQQFLSDQIGYTQGVGLSYQVEFDTFKQLMRKIFKKSDAKKEEKKKKPETQEVVKDDLLNFSPKKKKKSSSQNKK